MNLAGRMTGESGRRGASGVIKGPRGRSSPPPPPGAEPPEHSHMPSSSNYMLAYYSLLLKQELPPAPASGVGTRLRAWAEQGHWVERNGGGGGVAVAGEGEYTGAVVTECPL